MGDEYEHPFNAKSQALVWALSDQLCHLDQIAKNNEITNTCKGHEGLGRQPTLSSYLPAFH